MYPRVSLRSRSEIHKHMVSQFESAPSAIFGLAPRFLVQEKEYSKTFSIGFGRKMYTDYEIVCKVRKDIGSGPSPLLIVCASHRPISLRSNCAILSSAGGTQILKPSAISLSTNLHESISHHYPEKSLRIGSLMRLSRAEGKDWRGSSVLLPDIRFFK